ncbi:hypothetical protein BTA51_16410 [Hahella sp. CCB-MM4]|nr:hypothetical protein BTA51_16410 [Hahella sp. CCB-MM4]
MKTASRHINAFLTFLGLLPLVYFIPPVFERLIPDNHFFVVMLSVAAIVILMTYLIMPLFLRSLKLFTSNRKQT